MFLNAMVFHTYRCISSRPATFQFLTFLSTDRSFSCVKCPSLMPNCLLKILAIGLCMTFRGFPSKSSKCFSHCCIRSSLLVVFSLAFAMLFLLLTSFSVCHAILDGLSFTESLKDIKIRSIILERSVIALFNFSHCLIA